MNKSKEDLCRAMVMDLGKKGSTLQQWMWNRQEFLCLVVAQRLARKNPEHRETNQHTTNYGTNNFNDKQHTPERWRKYDVCLSRHPPPTVDGETSNEAAQPRQPPSPRNYIAQRNARIQPGVIGWDTRKQGLKLPRVLRSCSHSQNKQQ